MEEKASAIKDALAIALIILLLLSGGLVLLGLLQGHFSSPERLRDYISSFGLFAPLVLTLIQAIQVVLPVLPGFLGCVVGAGLFGAAGGFWCNYIGISTGSIAAYLLARYFGVELVRQFVPMDKYQSYTAWANKGKYFTIILFLAILLPLAPDDFLCYLSGLSKISARRFIWIILVAKPWCILFYCLCTAALLP